MPDTVTLATLRDRLDLPAEVVGDAELAEMLDSCRAVQSAYCEGFGPALDRALIRRVAREVAAKGMPLGAQATEYGTFFLPSWSDPVLAALEAPYLRGGFA